MSPIKANKIPAQNGAEMDKKPILAPINILSTRGLYFV